jgi:glutathione S-transferase
VLKLYWHSFSIMPWRVRIALAEKDVAHELVHVDLPAGEQRTPGFRHLSPFGQIPVIDDGGLVIAESLAILEYLEERHPEPALLPLEVADRARVRQLMCWSTDYWPPAWKKWMAPRLDGTAWTEASVAQGRRELADHLDVIEGWLDGREWLVGQYSLADVCYAPLVLVLDRVGLEAELDGRRNVREWTKRLRGRAAIRNTLMPELKT